MKVRSWLLLLLELGRRRQVAPGLSRDLRGASEAAEGTHNAIVLLGNRDTIIVVFFFPVGTVS